MTYRKQYPIFQSLERTETHMTMKTTMIDLLIAMALAPLVFNWAFDAAMAWLR